jgi:hypothetical protein
MESSHVAYENEASLQTMLELVSQKSLIKKNRLWILDNLPSPSSLKDGEKKLLKKLLSHLTRPVNTRYFFFVSVPPRFPESLLTDLTYAEEEKLNLKTLQPLVDSLCSFFELSLPTSIIIQLSKDYLKEPLRIFSELRKLKVMPEEDLKDEKFVSQAIAKIDLEPELFSALDAVGVRHLMRCMKEFSVLFQAEEPGTEALLSQIKLHLKKLFFLKCLMEPFEELKLAKLSHQYLTIKSFREKKEIIAQIRETIEPAKEEKTRSQMLQTWFRSDYYLAKLIFQQNYFTRDELLYFISRCNHIHSKLHSGKTQAKELLTSFLLKLCNRKK